MLHPKNDNNNLIEYVKILTIQLIKDSTYCLPSAANKALYFSINQKFSELAKPSNIKITKTVQ